MSHIVLHMLSHIWSHTVAHIEYHTKTNCHLKNTVGPLFSREATLELAMSVRSFVRNAFSTLSSIDFLINQLVNQEPNIASRLS